MSNISTEQLQELTERVNDRLAEFGPIQIPKVSAGVVRLVYDVIDEWQADKWAVEPSDAATQPSQAEDLVTIAYSAGYERGKASANPADDVERLVTISAVPIDPPANGNGHHKAELSEQAAATLGPEHTVVTPLKSNVQSDAEREAIASARMGAAERAAQYREILLELQTMSVGGTMPTQEQWNKNRPSHLPTHSGILARYDLLDWGELAERAGLKYPDSRKKPKR